MKKLLIISFLIFVSCIKAQVSSDSLVKYIYNSWPETREYIELNDDSYTKVVELDTVLSAYLRV